MDSKLQDKVVDVTFAAAATLFAWVLWLGVVKLSGALGVDASVPNFDLWARVGAVVIGLGLFLYLSRSDTANQFMHEVVAELYRVTWPTHKETLSATYVVVIMVLLSGLVLGLMDKFWTLVIKQVL